MKPSLFLQVLSVESRKQMSYRVDFWINAFGSFITQLIIAYFLWQAIFAASEATEIGGFNLEGMVAYYVLVVLVSKLVRGDARAMEISGDIYEGGLTRYLLYPANYLGFKYAEALGGLAPALVQLALFGVVSFFLFDLGAHLTVTPASVAMCSATMILGSVLAFLITWPIQAVAFWADNVWSLNVMLRFISSILGGLMLPLSVFPEAAQELMTWLPFQYLYYFPVQVLLGKIGAAEWLQGMGIAAAWTVVVYLCGRAVWKRGLRSYTGVGI